MSWRSTLDSPSGRIARIAAAGGCRCRRRTLRLPLRCASLRNAVLCCAALRCSRRRLLLLLLMLHCATLCCAVLR
jgi:hypothetical protein